MGEIFLKLLNMSITASWIILAVLGLSLIHIQMCIRDRCMPGDNVEMTIELIHPIAMEQGLTFAIREGGRTVGSGRVATIIE